MEPGHPVALPRDDVCPYAPRRVSGGDVASDGARARLYRSLYGFRGAVEEAMLQHPDSRLSLLEGQREPSATPAVNVHGVQIHWVTSSCRAAATRHRRSSPAGTITPATSRTWGWC